MTNVLERDPTLRDLLRILDRRRRAVYGVTLAIFLIAVSLCVLMTRRYEATSVIQLQKSSSDSLGLDDLMGAASGGASDSLSLNVDLQTQASILQSDSLALRVIKELNLENNEDFKPHFSLIGWLMGLISPRGPADPKNASLDSSPRRRVQAIEIFQRHLKVKVTAGTRLIEVDYTNRDPKVAADVVNHLIQALIDYTFQTKFNATNDVSQWLEGQLGDLRKQSEDLQTKVVALQQGSGIFGVGGTDLQGKPVIYSPILDRLQESTAQLSQAEMSRILKESVYKIVQSGDPEQLSQLSGTSLSGTGSQGVQNSLALIQSLRTQEATIQAQIDQDSSQFGSAYPKLIEEKASLQGVQRAVRAEVNRIAARAKNDYEIALKSESGAHRAYDKDRSEAEKLNDKSIEYAILSKEADQSQDLYQDLLKRLKEAGILEGLRSSNITIVDIARPPAKPSQPKVPLYLALGAVLGIFFGGCSALFVDSIDNKVQGVEEIESMGLPLLGVVPQIEEDRPGAGVLILNSGYSPFGEAIRSLRSALLISRSGTPPQVLLVTSGSPGEGKSTLAVNLAASLAQFEKNVLLVEADMRRPVLRKRLGLKGSDGLSAILAGQDEPETFETLAASQHLYILPGGPTPPYPSELLSSRRMQSLIQQWREKYDFIVIDSPPVLPVTDAQILEELADATILVARVKQTTRIALKRSYDLIHQHVKDPTSPVIGVVLNFISLRSAAYYGYYGYYGGKKYGYDGGENDKTS